MWRKSKSRWVMATSTRKNGGHSCPLSKAILNHQTKLHAHGKQNNGSPQRCLFYNPWTWKCISTCSKRKWQVLLKVGTLKWRDDLELSSCTQRHHKGSCKPERQENQSQGLHVREDWMSHGGAGQCGQSLDTEKMRQQQQGLLWASTEEPSSAYSILAQWDPHQPSPEQ